mmetsp:Transcript_28912/g.86789  ORF Transcript_28912/g.86789 Transcript_28912/m.86789 type:complete len:237 (-) Transcript_28912:125-835(-)
MKKPNVTHCLWIVLVAAELLGVLFSFFGSAWLIKAGVELPIELGGDGSTTATVECGPLMYCIVDIKNRTAAISVPATDLSFGRFCATHYGAAITNLPFEGWTRASLFIIVAVILWLIVLVGALASLWVRRAAKEMRRVTAFATLLLILSTFMVLEAVRESAPKGGTAAIDQPLCRMCPGAGPFDLGGCSVGWALASGTTAMVLAIPLTALTYYVPHSYDVRRATSKVTPLSDHTYL